MLLGNWGSKHASSVFAEPRTDPRLPAFLCWWLFLAWMQDGFVIKAVSWSSGSMGWCCAEVGFAVSFWVTSFLISGNACLWVGANADCRTEFLSPLGAVSLSTSVLSGMLCFYQALLEGWKSCAWQHRWRYWVNASGLILSTGMWASADKEQIYGCSVLLLKTW